MRTLILITVHDPFALDCFIEEYNRNDCSVIALEQFAHQQAKKAGLPSQFVSSALQETAKERDSQFAKLCLPGVFGDTKFLGTDLDVADVLSIDRLSFWYGGKNSANVMDIISALNWERLVTNLDLTHPAPLYFMNHAKESVAICSKWNKELSDIAPHLTFDKIVTTEDIQSLLEKNEYAGTIETRKGKVTGQIDFQKRDGLRSGLGIGLNERVVGIIYDKEYDWQARSFVQNNNGNFIFFTEDDRSTALLSRCIPGAKHYNLSMAPICDEFVAFGYKPYLRKYGDKAQIVDPLGLNTL